MSERELVSLYGVDTGGTFTDLIWRSSAGELKVKKILSTPADPSQAIGAGIGALSGGEAHAGALIHGTTVATNALLERRGAQVAFVTTAGFEDLLWMRRQIRPWLYALEVKVEAPLVEEGLCFGVDERLGAGGKVIKALSEEEIERVVREVARSGAQAVVICLLHAFANGEHEERLAEAFRAHQGRWHVTTSREVTATFREYERASTAVINGYVGPVMASYLARLKERLERMEPLEVLQSHGGRADLEQAARLPVHTVLSGPAGGVVGAVEAAKEVGIHRIITFDMGGTSTDVSLADGAPTLTEEGTIGGFPLQVPVVDIFTVGAGGGSIAYVDAGGALKVGPRSAGADPGPAAYGRGGEAPTVTDAHVVLGSLPKEQRLGGALALDRSAAQKVVGELAAQLGLSVEETARGILEVADAAMARAIKVVSLERGYDPREYTLVAFGGAGGLHACRLARLLDMRHVVVPQFGGILSAVGMLRAAPKRLYSQTVLAPLSTCLEEGSDEGQRTRRLMRELEERAQAEMGAQGLELQWRVALRYQGQSFSIVLAVNWGGVEGSWSDPRARFEAEHERLYGYIAADRQVELVDLQLEARLEAPDWSWIKALNDGERGDGPGEAIVEEIDLGRGAERTQIIARSALKEGEVIVGPAVVVEYSGTTLVPAQWRAELRGGHLLLTFEEG